ncbi:hypothetical protein, partial [Enterococcus faecium]|uniref:hypothetical protein n=1 Tax=Enterococcus faecium TaxID=1352 RepID=UPI003D9FB45F
IELPHINDLYIPKNFQNGKLLGIGEPTWKKSYAFYLSGQNQQTDLPMSVPKFEKFIFTALFDKHSIQLLNDTGCTAMV